MGPCVVVWSTGCGAVDGHNIVFSISEYVPEEVYRKESQRIEQMELEELSVTPPVLVSALRMGDFASRPQDFINGHFLLL